MTILQISKVTSLPSTLTPSTMYLVTGINTNDLEIHVTDSTGVASRASMTRSEIAAMIANNGVTDTVIAALYVYKPNEIVSSGSDLAFHYCHKSFVFDKVVAATLHEYAHDDDLQVMVRSNSDYVISLATIPTGNKSVTDTTFVSYTTSIGENITIDVSTGNTTGKGLLVLLIKT